MKNAVLVFCALLAVAQGRTIEIGAVYKPRVVNGENAKLEDRPYQVALQKAAHQFCGGSIVNDYWVVTAAHCVDGKFASGVEVAAGSISLQEPYSLHQAVQIIMHETFTPGESYRNDIALIRVATPFKFLFRIQPAILPQPYAKVETTSPAVVSGWGRMSDDSTPDILQKATVYITDPNLCQTIIENRGYNIYPTHVYALTIHP